MGGRPATWRWTRSSSVAGRRDLAWVHRSSSVGDHIGSLAWCGAFLIAVVVSGCGKDAGTGPTPPPPPPPPPAPTPIAWGFCDPSRTPVWFAYQDSTGVWNPVQPGASGSYAFQFTHATGGVAWVTNQPGQGPSTEVTYGSAAELAGQGAGWCAAHPDRSKTLAASVTGVAPGEWVNVGLGSRYATLVGIPDVPTLISGLPAGPLDLTAMKFGGATVLGIIRRGIDLPDHAAIPVLDFANEAQPVPVATVTVSNAGSDLTTVNEFYVTARGNNLLYGSGFASRPAGETIYGIPAGAGLAGDLYLIRVSALRGGSATRDGVRAVAGFGNQAIALGPDVTPPTLSTTATTPYLRLRAAGPVQAGYGHSIVIGWQQALNPVSGSQATLTVTKAYLGVATGYDLTIPDFSGAAGWQNSWGLQAGAATFWFLRVSGVNGGIRDGYIELTAAIGGDLP